MVKVVCLISLFCYGKGSKFATEDFAQLTGNTRDTKYRFTMEKLIPVLDEYCSFPQLKKLIFLKEFFLLCYWK
jgi:serine/threonine-protein kinase HipA